MTNVKAYFRSHMRENLRTLVFILAIVLAVTALTGFNEQSRQYSFYDNEHMLHRGYDAGLDFSVGILILLAFVLPVSEFAFFKRRINLDCAYSLPISRRAMGTVHYLTGLITLFSAFTLSYLLNFAFLLSIGSEHFNFMPMLAHYFLCLILGFAIYSVMVFVFNEANSVGDGIWFMLQYTLVFGLIVLALALLIDNAYILDYGGASLPFRVFSTLTESYEGVIEVNYKLSFKKLLLWWQIPQYIFWLLFWIGLGILSAVGFFLSFGKRRTEKIGEISDSFFGSRTLIPVYALCLMIIQNLEFKHIAIWTIIELLALAGYTGYRRGFHYKKSDIAILCLLVIFLFV